MSSAQDLAAADLMAARVECRQLREELQSIRSTEKAASVGSEQQWMGYPKSRVLLAIAQVLLMALYFVMEDVLL